MSKTRLTFVILTLAVPAALAIELAAQRHASAETTAPSDDASTSPELPTAVAPQSPADVAKAARAASRAVMSRKADLAAACWTPRVAAQPEPAHSRHLLRETFDAEGHEVSRTVEDVPGQSRADVAECLRALPLDFEIQADAVLEASSRPTTITVTLAFP